MEQYVGLDVSQKETAICVIDGSGARLWEGTCQSTPEVIAGVLMPLALGCAGGARESAVTRCSWRHRGAGHGGEPVSHGAVTADSPAATPPVSAARPTPPDW